MKKRDARSRRTILRKRLGDRVGEGPGWLCVCVHVYIEWKCNTTNSTITI